MGSHGGGLALLCPAGEATPDRQAAGPRHELAPADPHCRPTESRPKPCQWVICRTCRNTVDPKRGTWIAGTASAGEYA